MRRLVDSYSKCSLVVDNDAKILYMVLLSLLENSQIEIWSVIIYRDHLSNYSLAFIIWM